MSKIENLLEKNEKNENIEPDKTVIMVYMQTICKFSYFVQMSNDYFYFKLENGEEYSQDTFKRRNLSNE
jgi:hypothetical protein